MKVKEIKALVQTKFLSMYDIKYQNKHGDTKHWTLATRKSQSDLDDIFFKDIPDAVDAVVMVSFHKETKSLVVIKQFRVPVNGYIYELPAGLIDAGETIETTAKREIKEETGLEVIEILYNYNKLYLTPGMTDESVSLVFCVCTGEISTENLEPDEDITPYLVDKKEASTILQSDCKMDIKLYLILLNFVNGSYDTLLK
ncbi:MAG: DNA mismatch repair protein MutT [Epulopiscium sp. Nuni2H_MBin003]|nr:MAG: DNA mismatch repair protein MutT [Epulopiscium sp. Nuni2H_MBin003]